MLYLVQHLDSGPGGRYQVRSLTVASGLLDDAPITDKRFVDEPMAGRPMTQLRRADGLVLTLYDGAEHPFIHALSSVEKWAICIDLPADTSSDAAAAKDWGLVQSDDGTTIFAVNVTLGLPIIRTSVDHGTALDLAGTGRADAGSLLAAIQLAVNLSKRQP